MVAPTLRRLRVCSRGALLLAVLLGSSASVALAQAFPMPNPPPGGPAPNPPPAAPIPAPTPAPVAPTPPRAAPKPPPAAPPANAPAAPVPSPIAPAPIAPAARPPQTIYPQPPTAAPQHPAPAQPSAAQLPPPQPVAPPPDATAQAAQPQVLPGTPVDAPEPEGTSPDDGVECAAGEFCFGGVLTAGALNVFGVGVHARMEHWGLGFDYQFISLGYEEVDGDLGLFTIEGRVYPFGGPFFLSLGVAWQSIALETTVTVDPGNGIPPQRVNAKGNVTMPLFKLGLGFMGRDGFVMGIDLGLGFRLGELDVNIDTNFDGIPEVEEAKAEFEEAAEAWLEWLPITPQLNILRIGYLF